MAAKVPTDPNMTPEIRRFLEAQVQAINDVETEIDNLNLGTAANFNVGTSASNIPQLDGSAKLPAVDGSQLTGITGRLIAGTPAVLNPCALNSTTTQAHGLATTPTFVAYVLECLIANLNYSVGDKLFLEHTAIQTVIDATNISLLTIGTPISIPDKSTKAITNITSADWKLTATPYKLT